MLDKGTIAQQHNFLGKEPIAISFVLRICLHLKENEPFVVRLSDKERQFVIPEDVFEKEDQRFGSSQNVEVVSDTESALRFTRLTILFADENKDIPLERIKAVYGNSILEALNKFIDIYRFVTQRYAIQSIYDLDDVQELTINRGSMFETQINFGGRNASLLPFKRPREEHEHERIRGLAIKDEPFPLERLFLMDARRHAIIGHNLQSLINCVIALEIVLNKEWSQFYFWDRIFNYFWVGRYTRIKAKRVIRKKKAPKQLIENVLASLKERNNIIHRGRRVLKEEINDHLATIEEAINLVGLRPLPRPLIIERGMPSEKPFKYLILC